VLLPFLRCCKDNRQADQEIVEYMADASSQCGSCYVSDSNQSRSITRGNIVFASEDPSPFKGIILDIGSNRASTMSRERCNMYCKMCGVPRRIRKKLPGSGHEIQGIGGSARVIGTAQIPVPFTGLDLYKGLKVERASFLRTDIFIDRR
jgi:hypothetical protein